MRCSNCGAEIRDGSAFCHECGFPVKKMYRRSENPYVVITGSTINLDEKTEVYREVRNIMTRSILTLIFHWVPLLPIILGITVLIRTSDVKQILDSYDNEKNLLNAIVTDKLRWNCFWSNVMVIYAIVMQIFIIAIILLINAFASNMARMFGGFGLF